ncbi:MAG: FAD/NAD(P)-binding protein [Treponema sp.]|nr:FAD/NAD(P)-binding protein [Treponema sp.]
MEKKYTDYDAVIIGAGPGGIYAAYRLAEQTPKNKHLKIAIIDKGKKLIDRHCPSKEKNIKCINCKICAIMEGFGGCGAVSDFKFPITNDFGGTLWEKVGKPKALELMYYVDHINKDILEKKGITIPTLFSSRKSKFRKLCTQNNLHLLDAEIRHLGTDLGQIVMQELYDILCKADVDFYFETRVTSIEYTPTPAGDNTYIIHSDNATWQAHNVIISAGRSGSKWLGQVCKELNISTISNRVDIGVRVELPEEIFSHITDELYESKIVYKTKTYEDNVRTFCMNPRGAVVTENVDGYITVNGHSYEDERLKTNNTNFALLCSKHFTQPFNNSNEYGESIVRLSNMLGGGVIVQRFGDLIRGKRSTSARIEDSTVTPTLQAEPGDLSLVLPKRILDNIIEMLYALDKIAPGTANDDTLLYGVEVKFYNMEVDVTENLEAKAYPGLFIIGDGSGHTHSLSQSAASGVHVADVILQR